MTNIPAHWKRPVRLPPGISSIKHETTPPQPKPCIQSPWRALHRYSIDNRHTWDPKTAARWYNRTWLPMVPVHLPDGATCGCQSHWTELTKNNPPDFSSAESFERWAFDRHNDVSREHSGAKRISWEQSQRLWNGPRVGFIATAYMRIGGTETFHRTLLPRLRHYVDIVGFHATDCQGDTDRLRVTYYSNRQDLINNCDVIVTWGIDDIRDCAGKYVISMHHADCKSDWSDNHQLKPEINQIVCVHPDVPSHLSKLTSKPCRYIPNPIDAPSLSGMNVRTQQLSGKKIILWPHRWSDEKQPLLALEIAKNLTSDFALVITADDGPQADNAVYVGKQDNVADWISESHCTLSLSTFEGFGYSVAESMLLGVPVVSYTNGICNDSNSTIIREGSSAGDIAKMCISPARHSKDAFRFLECHDSELIAQLWSEMLHSIKETTK